MSSQTRPRCCAPRDILAYPPFMTVRALLDGHQFDLQALAELFPDDDPRVVVDPNEDGRYFLEAAALDPLFNDPGAMHDAAAALLVRLIGAARLQSGSFQPVTLAGRYDRASSTGSTETAIQISDTAHARERVTVVAVEGIQSRAHVGNPTVLIDGVRVDQQPRGPRYLTLAATHTDVAELLALVGNADQLNWIELYKAYEIIKHAVGGGKDGIRALAAALDVPEVDIKRFTGSANRPDVSGPDARHARMAGARPRQTMTLPDGRQFIRDLAHRWLDTLV
jgi:hypothetical protein